jgi:replicative DNA helicase
MDQGKLTPRTVFQVVTDLYREGPETAPTPFATGYDPLDRILDGGFRKRDLALVTGVPGVGKTVATLQWARHMARRGDNVIYVCYEHDEQALLTRLLLVEIGYSDLADDEKRAARYALRRVGINGFDLGTAISTTPSLAKAHDSITDFAGQMWLLRASGAYTGLPELDRMVVERGSGNTVLFVDYLQKVAVIPEPPDEAEKITRIAEGLKEIALDRGVAVVAIAAADRAGLESRRLRLHHLRGSSAIAYEADIVIILNEKFDIVSKAHLAYDPTRVEGYKAVSVLSLEKNRGGPAKVDLEFKKDFEHYRYQPTGGFVSERLIDERLVTE